VLEDGLRAEQVRDNGGKNPYHWVMPAVSAAGALLVGLLLVLAIYLVARGADLHSLLAFGYPGVSVVMFFSSATVLLPAPGFATVLAASGLVQLNPYVLGLFAGIGSSAGELTGYLVGLGGRKAFHRSDGRWLRRTEYFMRRWGFLTILTMATIPNPFFDAVGILAGSLGYSPRRLWVACMIGNTVKYTALALLGGTAASIFSAG
jgi:membrane protein YqaA with SNARE-associated domain